MKNNHTKLHTSQHPSLKILDKVALLMDDAFTIPGTKIKIGLDPIISMLPVAGDTASFIVSALTILVSARNGASPKVLTQMAFNVLVDYVVGTVPVVGDLFDFYFKANRKNYQLMKEYYDKNPQAAKKSSNTLSIAVAIGLVMLLGAGLVGIFIGLKMLFFD